MTVLVTGATGNVGRHVIEELLRERHAGRTYVMSGPEVLDVPQKIAVLGRGIEFVELSEEQACERMRRAGASAEAAERRFRPVRCGLRTGR
ncbi:SDR family oxidoreductase [Spirillospora sp. NPDC050679]